MSTDAERRQTYLLAREEHVRERQMFDGDKPLSKATLRWEHVPTWVHVDEHTRLPPVDMAEVLEQVRLGHYTQLTRRADSVLQDPLLLVDAAATRYVRINPRPRWKMATRKQRLNALTQAEHELHKREREAKQRARQLRRAREAELQREERAQQRERWDREWVEDKRRADAYIALAARHDAATEKAAEAAVRYASE